MAYIDSGEMDRHTSENSRIAKAFLWSNLVDEGVLREWLVSIGRRDAFERIGHLFCELHFRLKLIGLVEDDRMDLPLTQEDIADATGLTAVHTNRTLQRLRGEGLIELPSHVLTINDIGVLRDRAGFNPAYLQIKRRVS